MTQINLDEHEVLELAACICELDPDNTDETVIRNTLQEKFEIELESFKYLVTALFYCLKLDISPITHTPYIGLVQKKKDYSRWIAKEDYTSEFINSIIDWMSAGEPDVPNRANYRAITINGIPKYELVLAPIKADDQEESKEMLDG